MAASSLHLSTYATVCYYYYHRHCFHDHHSDDHLHAVVGGIGAHAIRCAQLKTFVVVVKEPNNVNGFQLIL